MNNALMLQLGKYGIKDYMKKHFNQDYDTTLIEDVFYRMVNAFPKEYHSIISHSLNNDKNNYYYKQLFKQDNLIQ